jgi:cysteinyl-tRNA synthetase
MHNGLMKMGHTKMAGSVGNVINVSDLLQKHDAETVRFLLLSTHYRSPIEYSEDRLAEVRRALEGFYRFFERYQRVAKKSFYDVVALRHRADFHATTDFLHEIGQLRERFLDSMDDDFNTGGAVGVLYELLTALNRFADARQLEGPSPAAGAVSEFQSGVVVLRELSQILGLFREAPRTAKAGDDQLVNGLMQLLIDLRAELRKAKNFALADQIRKRLGELGVTLEDRPGGTGWRVG